MRGVAGGKVEAGVDQHLARQHSAKQAITIDQRSNRRQICAGAIAGEANPGTIDSDSVGVSEDPGNCCERVLERIRKRVFRSKPVFDPEDVRWQYVGKLSAERLIDTEIAHGPSAA